ncbi:MAG: hypothetical protein Q7T26_00955 [Dehalococcoidia bacterium]|nr:hypothetical protein [Dehalococcoidia bacterium]
MAQTTLSLHDLAKRHREMSPSVGRLSEAAVHLWYADLNVEVHGERVRYSCPKCAKLVNTSTEEFEHYERSDQALLCLSCRGDPHERNAGL